MHFSDYQLGAMRTRGRYPNVQGQSFNACLGMSGELGEYLDLKKKAIFHNKLISPDKLKEELGDLLWYIALECDAMGFSMDDIAGTNIEKLKIRFPNGFNSGQANCELRDLKGHNKSTCSNCNPWLQ